MLLICLRILRMLFLPNGSQQVEDIFVNPEKKKRKILSLMNLFIVLFFLIYTANLLIFYGSNQPAGLAVCQITELNLRCNNGVCVRGPYKPGDKCLFDSQCTTSLIGAELFCNTTCKFAKYAE